eukprot:TRINITY_DN5770_c0_g1_i1.p1 TRINITY_DN5770_c0_g1~~TRINITY_DN5770_c0_g1_i1.p1  ORF type:complete len:302 (+),score=101.90 TRINITY_DN5770_c0_g1_i1:30-908(+)
MPRQKAQPQKKESASNLKRKADESSEVEEQEVHVVHPFEAEPGCEVPRFNTKIHFHSRRFVVNVVLHKIPDNCIGLEPTDDQFYMHTKKFTKKYSLKFDYPQNMKVDAEACTAEFNGSTLTCTFPITQIMDKETGKTLRKKQKTSSEQTPAQAPVVTEKPKTKAAPKKKKQPAAQGNTATEEKSKTLELIEEVAAKVDQTQKRKVENEKAKEKFFQEKSQKAQEKKEKKIEQRQNAIQKAKSLKDKEQTEQKKQQELAQKPFKASRVKFSEPEEVTPKKKASPSKAKKTTKK